APIQIPRVAQLAGHQGPLRPEGELAGDVQQAAGKNGGHIGGDGRGSDGEGNALRGEMVFDAAHGERHEHGGRPWVKGGLVRCSLAHLRNTALAGARCALESAGPAGAKAIGTGENQPGGKPIMNHRARGLRLVTAACAIAAATFCLAGSPAAFAQERPADLTALPPVPTDYTPGKTPWGDYDFRGTWPIEYINNARILFQRPKSYGNRVWLNDA